MTIKDKRDDERSLLRRLQKIHGYALLKMPNERDRTLCSFRMVRGRMIYGTATVMRLAVPSKSWLAIEAEAKAATAIKRKAKR